MSARPIAIAVLLHAGLALHAGIGGVPQGTERPQALKKVGIEQRINESLPMDAEFTDEYNQKRKLGDLLGKRPAVLALVYYECPMLCTMVLNGLLRTTRAMTLSAGRDFDVLAVSFDPSENAQLASRKKHEYLERYNRSGSKDGWHFLTGDQANISRLTEAAGFRYDRDPNTGQWAHASAIMAVTPDGRLARYFYGVEYSARDLRFGLVEASKGKVGSAIDQVLLFCFHYDPATGKYGLLIRNILRGAAGLTVLALASFWFACWWQSRRRKNHHERLPATS